MDTVALHLMTCNACPRRQPPPHAGTCACLVDGRDVMEHARAGECPEGRYPEPGSVPLGRRPAPAPAVPAAVTVAGPALWAWLHAWGGTVDLSTPEARAAAAKDLDAFADRLPCGECRDHWNKLVAESPPDYADNASLYQWTWRVHNIINARLGKREVTLEEAMSLHPPKASG